MRRNILSGKKWIIELTLTDFLFFVVVFLLSWHALIQKLRTIMCPAQYSSIQTAHSHSQCVEYCRLVSDPTVVGAPPERRVLIRKLLGKVSMRGSAWVLLYSAIVVVIWVPQEMILPWFEQFVTQCIYRALWFLRSRNRGRNRGIGRLKRNVLFNTEYRGFDIISLKCCFRVVEKRMSEENCTGGSRSGWLPTDWAPPSKQCKRGEAAAHGSVFVGEKAEKLDI